LLGWAFLGAGLGFGNLGAQLWLIDKVYPRLIRREFAALNQYFEHLLGSSVYAFVLFTTVLFLGAVMGLGYALIEPRLSVRSPLRKAASMIIGASLLVGIETFSIVSLTFAHRSSWIFDHVIVPLFIGNYLFGASLGLIYNHRKIRRLSITV